MKKTKPQAGADGKTGGGRAQELGQTIPIEIPLRWCLPDKTATRSQCLAELVRLGECFETGANALAGLYLRITDHVRHYELQADEVRESLGKAGMAKARISEIWRVATAPEDVYREYSARLIGFKVALERSRLCRMVARSTEAWARKKLARTARNLLKQARYMSSNEFKFKWRGWVVLAVPELNITYIEPADYQ